MAESQTEPASMYCRQCSYMLFGLSENRCPECGLAFDPANHLTFRRHPRRTWREWAGLILLVFLVLLAVTVGGIGGTGLLVLFVVPLYWRESRRQHREERARDGRRAASGRTRP